MKQHFIKKLLGKDKSEKAKLSNFFARTSQNNNSLNFGYTSQYKKKNIFSSDKKDVSYKHSKHSHTNSLSKTNEGNNKNKSLQRKIDVSDNNCFRNTSLNRADSNHFEIIEEIEKPDSEERKEDFDFKKNMGGLMSYSLDRKVPSNNSRNTSQNSNRCKKNLNFYTSNNVSPDHSNIILNKNFTFNKSNDNESQRVIDTKSEYKESNAVVNLISLNKMNRDKNIMDSSLLNRTVKNKLFQKDNLTQGKKIENHNRDKLVSPNNKRIEIKQENTIKVGYSTKAKKGYEKDYRSNKLSSIDSKNRKKITVLNEKDNNFIVSPNKMMSSSKFFTENNIQNEKIFKKSQDNKDEEGNRLDIEPFKTTIRNKHIKNNSIDAKGKNNEKSIELNKTQLNDKKIINLIDKNDLKSFDNRNGNTHFNNKKNVDLRMKKIEEKKGNKSLISKKENSILNENKKVIINLDINKIKVIEEKSSEKKNKKVKATSGQDSNIKGVDNNKYSSIEDKNGNKINKKFLENGQDDLKEDFIKKHENTEIGSNNQLEDNDVKMDEKDESLIEEAFKDIKVKNTSNTDVRKDIFAVNETNKHPNENILETESNNFITEKDIDYISKLDTNEKTNQEIMNENDLSHKFSELIIKEENEPIAILKKDVVHPELNFNILIKDKLNDSNIDKSGQSVEIKLTEESKPTPSSNDKEVSTNNLKEESLETKIKKENINISDSYSKGDTQNEQSEIKNEEIEDKQKIKPSQENPIENRVSHLENSDGAFRLIVNETNERNENKSSDVNKADTASSNINEDGSIIDKNREKREKLSRFDQQLNRLRASICVKKSILNEENDVKPAENKIDIRSKIQGLQAHFMKQATINNTANIAALLNDKTETLKTTIERSYPNENKLENENNFDEILLNRPVRKNTVTKKKRPDF